MYLVGVLSRRVTTDRHAEVALRKILGSQAGASLRAACAWALGRVAKDKDSVRRLLLKALDGDRAEKVRHACAAALGDVAVHDAASRRRLAKILDSDLPTAVRAGAARGLGKAAASDAAISELLRRHAARQDESSEVRTSCACALEPLIADEPAVARDFRSWLEASDCPGLQRVAAESLATAMAAPHEKVPWDGQAVERVQSILMNLEDPCPCALEGLEALAGARQVRRGLRLEGVLCDSLRCLADRIALAFVFGSVARNRQSEESDIDLFVMGDVSLKSLSTPLREAERTLGRRISPVIYSRESFQERCHAGDPFLLDIYRREKIPVIGAEGDSSREGLDDELRTMVAERLASAQ
jgi:predicted nucleotidyltransferase